MARRYYRRRQGKFTWTGLFVGLLILAGFAGVVLLYVFIVGRLTKSKPATTARATPPVPPPTAWFCPQCGTPAAPGGRFCGSCGQQLG